ncbi:MAG TPA: hypothetical protein DCM12_00795, partial [Gammaproteobacteria bacterium]|nr:hypothetical protein [Gammaproteobacteria bacterium]
MDLLKSFKTNKLFAILTLLFSSFASIAAPATIVPFEIAVSNEAISDLKNRLQNTRLPDQISQTTWEYGTDREYLIELIDYWRNEFNWREQESTLNQFDQFKTEIDGLEMHFIHQRSPHPHALP